MQTSLGLRKNATESKKPGLSFASRPASIEPCSFVFRFTCPTKKPIRRNNAIAASHCRVIFFRSSLTTQRRKGVFVDRQLSYSRSSLSRYSWVPHVAANDCWFQVKYLLQHSSSFSLASASRVLHDNESWHARQRAYLTSTYNLNSYDSGTRAWADVHAKKPYHNVARRSPLIFSIFPHQISCMRVQSISETASQ